MNALDKAFIRAYSKGATATLAPEAGDAEFEAPDRSAPAAVEQNEVGVQRAAAASQNRASAEVGRLSPLVEVFAADGVWYRIEQPADHGGSAHHGGHAAYRTPPMAQVPTTPSALSQEATHGGPSASEALDTLLGLHPRSHLPAVGEESQAMFIRVDGTTGRDRQRPIPAEKTAPQGPALLEQRELDAFAQCADASVVTQGWEGSQNLETRLESLCQYCFAEDIAAPMVLEQTWVQAPALPAIMTPTGATAPKPVKTPDASAAAQERSPVPPVEAARPMPEAPTSEALTPAAPAVAEATQSCTAETTPTCDAAAPSIAGKTEVTTSKIEAMPSAPPVEPAPVAPAINAPAPVAPTPAAPAPVASVETSPQVEATPSLPTPQAPRSETRTAPPATPAAASPAPASSPAPIPASAPVAPTLDMVEKQVAGGPAAPTTPAASNNHAPNSHAPHSHAPPHNQVTAATAPAAVTDSSTRGVTPPVETPNPLATTATGAAAKTAPAAHSPHETTAGAPATSSAVKPAPAFQAAWEVDRLSWPEECERLARGDAFGSLAKTLVDTSRRGKKVIAVTGLGRGEGRTTLALCLARRIAKEGVQVAILDADFERPHLGRCLGIDMENGWDDVLTDGQPLAEAAVSSLEDGLTVLPLGRRAAALVSAHTVAALQQASAAFEIVLVDMGPVSEEEHGESAGEGVSPVAALMVCDRRHATDASLAKAMDRLSSVGIETLGVVETFA